ncbi:MAG TPA: hypothetical protein P5549_05875, partial [Syntrophomonas sp.]|nr:hypothetical protein [Syntrophomonas sp.]
MNHKTAASILAVLLFFGVCIYISGIIKPLDKLAGSERTNEIKTTQNSLEQRASVDKEVTVKRTDSQKKTKKVQSPAPPAEPKIVQVQTENSVQDKSSNPSSGTTSVNQHESSAASNPAGSGSNPVSQGNSTNSSNNQVSRG